MSKKFVLWIKGPYGPWEETNDPPAAERTVAERQAKVMAGNAQLITQICEVGKQPWEGQV